MAARQTGIGGTPMSDALAHAADRRRSGRIDATIRATVRCSELEEHATSVCRARVRDISDLGVCILLRRRLPEQARVEIDMECELPLRVHLGFDVHSLVVDGPMHTHLVRVTGTVKRVQRLPNRLFQIGIEFCDKSTHIDELQAIGYFLDHLREQEEWFF